MSFFFTLFSPEVYLKTRIWKQTVWKVKTRPKGRVLWRNIAGKRCICQVNEYWVIGCELIWEECKLITRKSKYRMFREIILLVGQESGSIYPQLLPVMGWRLPWGEEASGPAALTTAHSKAKDVETEKILRQGNSSAVLGKWAHLHWNEKVIHHWVLHKT